MEKTYTEGASWGVIIETDTAVKISTETVFKVGKIKARKSADS